MSREKSAPEKVQLALTKPIQAHGEQIAVLEFRPPTGEDLLEVGAPPFIIDKKERTHIDLTVTGEYIERLCDIPRSSVKLMSPADMIAAFGVVAGFFGDTETIRKKSSDDTMN